MTRRWSLVAALGIGLAVVGCYRTTVRSGLPPGDTPEAYDDNWHNGWLLGAVETSGPYALDRICPNGWAEVHSSFNVLQGLLSLITYGIYTPQSVTIVCAAERPPGPPPREGYPPRPAPAGSTYPPPPTSSGYPPPPPRPYHF